MDHSVLIALITYSVTLQAASSASNRTTTTTKSSLVTLFRAVGSVAETQAVRTTISHPVQHNRDHGTGRGKRPPQNYGPTFHAPRLAPGCRTVLVHLNGSLGQQFGARFIGRLFYIFDFVNYAPWSPLSPFRDLLIENARTRKRCINGYVRPGNIVAVGPNSWLRPLR